MRVLLGAVCLLQAWGAADGLLVSGYEGAGLSFRCDYQKKYENNPKYLCKAYGIIQIPCTDLIKTGKKNEWVTKGRFSLYDDRGGRFFTVNITGLQQADAGTYWCGVDIDWSRDTYTEVSLEVLKGPNSTDTTKPPTATTTGKKVSTAATAILPTVTASPTLAGSVTASGKPSGTTPGKTALPEMLLPITVGLTVVLLLLGLALLIFYSQKRRKPAESKPHSDQTNACTWHPDTTHFSSEYEEIKEQIPEVPSLYCTADFPENASPVAVYSTVNPPKASCSDSLNYTTVNFSENLACTKDSTINFTKDSEYATVTL